MKKARTRHGARGVERQTRLVEELRLAQEPHAVARRNPIGAEVLGVAVRRRSFGARVERGVHLAEVVGVEHVVGVENEIRLMARVSVALPYGLQPEIERVALPHPSR